MQWVSFAEAMISEYSNLISTPKLIWPETKLGSSSEVDLAIKAPCS